MNRMVGVMKMHLQRDAHLWFYVPLLVEMASFIISITIALLVEGENAYITGGSFAVLIVMLVSGIITMSDTFPFVLGMGVRRHDYYWGTTAIVAIQVAAVSAFMVLCSVLERGVSGWGLHLRFFSMPWLNDGTAPEQFVVLLVFMLNMFYLGFVIAGIRQRFRAFGMLVLSAATVLLITLASYLHWWPSVFRWLAAQTAFSFAIWLVPVTVVYALGSYLLVRRATA